MADAAKILADQIGTLVIANAEQAALIAQLKNKIADLETVRSDAKQEKVILDETGFGGGFG